MRKLTSVLSITLSTAALALSGAAVAQNAPIQDRATARAPQADMTRADAQARAERAFARMDVNQDGRVDEADRAAMKARAFDRLDTDRNGAISQAEFSARHGERAGKARMAKREGAPALTDAQKAERQAQAFARLDTDGNGSISRAEFDAMPAARAGRPGGKRGGERAAAAGPLTRQAFVDRALSMFDRADANRDGTVTQAERQAARAAMREQWQARKAPRQQG